MIKKPNNVHNILMEKLFKEQSEYFFKIAYLILNNKCDAEDALSESFIRISKYIERISQLKCPEIVPYCISIVKTVSYKMKKEKSKIIYTDLSDNLIDKDGKAESVDATLERMIENEDLEVLLSSLTDLEYEILELRVIDKFTYKKIGEIIGISEEAAKKRYQRLIKKLCEMAGNRNE